MVATATLWASGTPATTASGAGTWAGAANAAGANDGVYAGFTSVTTAEVGTILCTGYAADAALGMEIPTSVDSVVATVYVHVTGATGRWTSVTARLMDGATALGATETTVTLSTTATFSQALTFTGVAAWANLAGLGVRITGTKANTTSSVMDVDAIGVVVNYTPSAVTGNTYSGGSYLIQIG